MMLMVNVLGNLNNLLISNNLVIENLKKFMRIISCKYCRNKIQVKNYIALMHDLISSIVVNAPRIDRNYYVKIKPIVKHS